MLFPTDRSRIAIIDLHKRTLESGQKSVNVKRRKSEGDFNFTDIPFKIDPDDYHYIPGLQRPWDSGFLAPLFFKKTVLLKFDNSPDYRVRFASQSYGTIDMEESYISFGINRHGKIVMWLGDVAKLPESEQYYLRSENVESDHSIGSEFYDGQIECKFTDPPKERVVITARSEFEKSFENRFSEKLFHLDAELIDTIAGLTPPLVDTEKERKHIFDSLNRIFVEAMDNAMLERLGNNLGVKSTGSGSLKRIQAVLETVEAQPAISKALMPFYVLYDLRIAYSHLTSTKKRQKLLADSESRLGLNANANLSEFYDALLDSLIASLQSVISAMQILPLETK